LAQQPIEVFIAAALPACKWPRKVDGDLKLFINMCMRCGLFAVAKGQRLYTGNNMFVLGYSGLADSL
jgi:hypothetical protein